ncbi:hypothetical protein LOK49_LG08G02003 [Camellia lanceoleosa]|uniref:Uncharacterized protein n=1 Tax=Camellia lanceoleosa TaxID=1840588 RepID=A0ACC0GS80_9ERIC|nr:hypothetical protein LOK49_Contig292G00008 [Camellia lanceoleosa]KAI8003556.1 hypothetical protein LOK49_LG08G02003 [Camellia lanceoleosa]
MVSMAKKVIVAIITLNLIVMMTMAEAPAPFIPCCNSKITDCCPAATTTTTAHEEPLSIKSDKRIAHPYPLLRARPAASMAFPLFTVRPTSCCDQYIQTCCKP